MGGVCKSGWMSQQWDEQFILNNDPSIEYLELYALLATELNWVHRFCNKRIIIFCDNISVVHMVNNMSSSCPNCMVLIRKLVLTSMIEIVCIYAKYVSSKNNLRADHLSRLKIRVFKEKFPDTDENLTAMQKELWPMQKLWISKNKPQEV